MSLINNPSWIGFDGTPLTGKVPARLMMMAGTITPALLAEVQHAYHLFCLGKTTAVGDFFVTNRLLRDGSRVRCESMQGQDRVMVWSVNAPSRKMEIDGEFVFFWKFLQFTPPGNLEYGFDHNSWRNYAGTNMPATPTAFKERRVHGSRSWSSGMFTRKGKPVQLTWDGWLGGLVDFWVGGHPKQIFFPGTNNLASESISAACIARRPDGKLVIRAAVRRAGADIIFLSYFVDFINADTGEAFDDLSALMQARRLNAENVKPFPSGEKPFANRITEDGEWTQRGRMSFNSSGTAVAFITAVMGRRVRSSSASSVEEEFPTPGLAIAVVSYDDNTTLQCTYAATSESSTRAETVSSFVPSYGRYVGYENTTGTARVRSIVDVGFLGDELVWVWKQCERESVYRVDSTQNQNVLNRSVRWTITAGHSRHGELVRLTNDMGFSGQTLLSTGGNSISGAWSGASKYLDIGYGGDLSRDSFCIGLCEDAMAPTPILTDSGAPLQDGYLSLTGQDVDVALVKMRYDVYLGGRRVARGLDAARCFSSIDPPYTPRAQDLTISNGRVVRKNYGAYSMYVYDQLPRPEDAGVDEYSTSCNVDAGGYVFAPYYRRWALDPVGFEDVTAWSGLLIVVDDGKTAECAVAPDARAVFVSDPDFSLSANYGPNRAGMCHFIRLKKEGSTAEMFRMAFEGPAVEPGKQYLITPRDGAFDYRAQDLDTA